MGNTKKSRSKATARKPPQVATSTEKSESHIIIPRNNIIVGGILLFLFVVGSLSDISGAWNAIQSLSPFRARAGGEVTATQPAALAPIPTAEQSSLRKRVLLKGTRNTLRLTRDSNANKSRDVLLEGYSTEYQLTIEENDIIDISVEGSMNIVHIPALPGSNVMVSIYLNGYGATIYNLSDSPNVRILDDGSDSKILTQAE